MLFANTCYTLKGRATILGGVHGYYRCTRALTFAYPPLKAHAGVPLTQLSKLLGHADIATTQRYLNLDLDLETTASDFIPLD